MFCPNCGNDLPQGVGFCPECGAQVNISEEQINGNPWVNQYQQNDVWGEEPVSPNAGKVDFVTAIKLFFNNYANFEGRATKTEYWWAFLFNFLASLAAGFIPYVGYVVSLALLIPGLSVGVRRLHDTGKRWTYMFICLIPIVGTILYIIQLCKDSDGDNEWGPRPR